MTGKTDGFHDVADADGVGLAGENAHAAGVVLHDETLAGHAEGDDALDLEAAAGEAIGVEGGDGVDVGVAMAKGSAGAPSRILIWSRLGTWRVMPLSWRRTFSSEVQAP